MGKFLQFSSFTEISFCRPKNSWCYLSQCNVTDKNPLLLLYPGSSLKWLQELNIQVLYI